jgi:hypothetical protein
MISILTFLASTLIRDSAGALTGAIEGYLVVIII